MARIVKWLFRYVAPAVACAAATALAADTRSAVVSHKPAPASTAHTRTAPARKTNLSDAEIERAIRAKFAASKIGADHFEAHVQGGIATLAGHTDVIQHKGTATRLAKTAGASQVVNHIQISQAARDKAMANLAKGRRRAQVKRGELRSDRGEAR
jgi:osmotically-inducible protein OsmY